MYIHQSKFTFYYRLMLLVLSGVSIIQHLSFTNPVYTTRMLGYFTVLSVVLIFLVYIPLTWYSFEELRGIPVFHCRYRLVILRGMALTAILITCLSYSFVLQAVGFSMYSYSSFYSLYKDSMVHFVIPLLVMLDWLLFQPKGLFRWYDCLTWLLFPSCYLVYILVRPMILPAAFFTGISRYPYFFLNIERLGIRRFLVFIFMYLAAILLLELVIILTDHLLLVLGMHLHHRKHIPSPTGSSPSDQTSSDEILESFHN